jgi:hypothetical protein
LLLAPGEDEPISLDQVGRHVPIRLKKIIHRVITHPGASSTFKLRFAGWTADRVGPIGTDWIETSWLRAAKRLLDEGANTWKANLPTNHAARVARMKLSPLDGLGLGDALGEMLCYQAQSAPRRLAANELKAGPWFHTDDTEMAISICAVLKSHGFIDQDALAKRFARRFERDPDRGYGKMTRIQMREIMAGAKWCDTAANAFGGQGSQGFMDGGIDRVFVSFFGVGIETKVRDAIARFPEGRLQIGSSLIVSTGHAVIPFLLVAPTMEAPEAVQKAYATHPPEFSRELRSAMHWVCPLRISRQNEFASAGKASGECVCCSAAE